MSLTDLKNARTRIEKLEIENEKLKHTIIRLSFEKGKMSEQIQAQHELIGDLNLDLDFYSNRTGYITQ